MRLPALLLAMIGLCGAAGPTTNPVSAPVELFDGKGLSGWVWVQRANKPGDTTPRVGIDAVWSVQDGVLRDKGSPIGYIRTTTEYNNYVLTVEERHVNRGNGGVLFAMTGQDKVWPHCLEAQTLNGEEGDIRGIANFHMTMDPARTEARRLRRIGPDPEKPVGQWETIQVIVDHGTVAIRVNDLLENLATQTGDLSGRIGLQAEGGEMEFRKIELTPLQGTDLTK